MADVEDIKAAVGEGDTSAFPAQALAQGAEFVAADKGGAHALRMTSVISLTLTVAVPRFMTTIPPAQLASRAACRKLAPAASASVNAAITVSPAPVTSTASSDTENGKMAGRAARLKQDHP